MEGGGASRSRTSTVGVVSNGTGNLSLPVKGIMASSNRTGDRRNTDAKVENNAKLEPVTTKESVTKVAAEKEQKKEEVNDGQVNRHLSKSPVRREENNVASVKQGDESGRERQAKRSVIPDDVEPLQKRRKGGSGADKNIEAGELVRSSERERFPEQLRFDQRLAERDPRGSHDERTFERVPRERSLDRPRDRTGTRGGERALDRVERDYRPVERVLDRTDRDRGEDYSSERFRDRSLENFARERSLDRGSDRGPDRVFERGTERLRDDRGKDERIRPRYNEVPGEQPHPDDRFPMQNQPHNLPPPPPLPPNVVPRIATSRVVRGDEEVFEGRSVRNVQRLSPRRDEKAEKRRTDDGGGMGAPLEEPKKRRDDDVRDRKRIDEREVQALKVCV